MGPQYKKNFDYLEEVQQRVTKMIHQDEALDNEEKLSELGWPDIFGSLTAAWQCLQVVYWEYRAMFLTVVCDGRAKERDI